MGLETPVNVGLIVPHSTFRQREYLNRIAKTFERGGASRMSYFQFAASQVKMRMLSANPSPLGESIGINTIEIDIMFNLCCRSRSLQGIGSRGN